MAMRGNWNPWHGCRKCSEGCENCYVYYLDERRGKSAADVYRTKTGFRYPVSRDRRGSYKVRPGETISVCMTSDFFLEEADEWRAEAWDIMRARPDVVFLLLTKRPQRVAASLPADWGQGWPNVFFNVSCENQRRADERIPILLDLPFAHKGVRLAPLLGPVDIGPYLDSGQIEVVACGGENYGGERPCDFEWVKALREACVARDVTFCFMETGTVFIKDGRRYRLGDKRLQTTQAHKSGMNYQGGAVHFDLTDCLGLPIPEEELYERRFCDHCTECSMRLICNGCSGCGRCGTCGPDGLGT